MSIISQTNPPLVNSFYERTVTDKLYDVVSVKDFGAVGDGVTDDTAAIQNAIDSTIYPEHPDYSNNGNKKVHIPGGTYLISDTIHLGYGLPLNSVVVEGDGYNYRISSLFNGTTLLVNFSDRPAINFQGSRGSVLRGISILGLFSTYVDDNDLCGSPALIDDTDENNWFDPSLNANQDSRYSPYAAISIDAYCGIRPATSYPDVNYPEFLGTVSQYSKGQSSNILISNCFISGFNVGIVNQPCNYDGNGDFLNIDNCYIEKCKYSVSVGNSQSRNVSIQNLKTSYIFTCFVNTKHGVQMGKFGGPILNLSVFRAISIFNFGSYYAGPITFDNMYAENLWRIGDQAAVSTAEHSYTFQSCTFSFNLQTEARGIPATVLSGVANNGGIHFNGCAFRNYYSVCHLNYMGLEFTNGCLFRQDKTQLFEQYAHNATCGGLITPPT